MAKFNAQRIEFMFISVSQDSLEDTNMWSNDSADACSLYKEDTRFVDLPTRCHSKYHGRDNNICLFQMNRHSKTQLQKLLGTEDEPDTR